MPNIAVLALIILGFYFLGRSADLVVVNVRRVGEKLGIRIFFLGLILGIFTSLPEFGVGVSATLNNIPEISFGNLIGGIMVIFGVIMGVSFWIQRRVHSDYLTSQFSFIAIFLILPLLLGMNGVISRSESLVLIALYFFLLYYLYRTHGKRSAKAELPTERDILKNSFIVVLGVTLLLLLSNAIIRLTTQVLVALAVPPFTLGLILFALGTNLPEVIIMFRSIRRHVQGLSMSNLIGSALANPLIIGILSFLRPIRLNVDEAYYAIMIFIAILLGTFVYMRRIGNEFTRAEGVLLVGIYLAFIAVQTWFLAIR